MEPPTAPPTGNPPSPPDQDHTGPSPQPTPPKENALSSWKQNLSKIKEIPLRIIVEALGGGLAILFGAWLITIIIYDKPVPEQIPPPIKESRFLQFPNTSPANVPSGVQCQVDEDREEVSITTKDGIRETISCKLPGPLDASGSRKFRLHLKNYPGGCLTIQAGDKYHYLEPVSGALCPDLASHYFFRASSGDIDLRLPGDAPLDDFKDLTITFDKGSALPKGARLKIELIH